MAEIPDEAHQFDFWIGRWDVFGPKGRQLGTNEIKPLFGGLVLHENWAGSGDVFGTSLNSWDPARGRWHQTWMDSTGETLLLDGGMRDGSMVMQGGSPDGETTVLNRITWTPASSGDELRQLWETSTDDGRTWEVAFDGRYVRVK